MKTLLFCSSLFISAFFSNVSFAQEALFNDSHFHLTNYIQQGTDIKKFLEIMDKKVERVALFGIPLQQSWSFRVSGKNAPKYYLDTDQGLYYYSFTDAFIASQYKSLTPEQQQRFDPMITGFNPTDMYAVDHIKRVLKTFPGVFSGIGEFTIHKEFVSSKIDGDVASLTDPALDKILDFAAESGLLVLIHNDMNVPFPKDGSTPAFFDEMLSLFKRHPKTKIIWAHFGVGRVVRPVKNHLKIIEQILKDKKLNNIYLDMSWDEVAKYVTESPEALKITADFLKKYPDRILFGTDVVAPEKPEDYYKVYSQYAPLWNLLDEATKKKVLFDNYNRLFDEANAKVREWEKKNIK